MKPAPHSTPARQRIAAAALALLMQFADQSWAQAPAATEPESSPAAESTEPEKAKRPIKNGVYRSGERLLSEEFNQAAVWLNDGESDFLGLYQPQYLGAAQGAVLMVFSEDLPRGRYEAFEALRQQLPEFGWSTLAIALYKQRPEPLPPRQPPPVKDQATEESAEENDAGPSADNSPIAPPPPEPNSTEDDSQSRPDNYDLEAENRATEAIAAAEAAQAKEEGDKADENEAPPPLDNRPIAEINLGRIRAAMAYLADQGQYNRALLGADYAASAAAGVLSDNPDTRDAVTALVLVNARNSHDENGQLNFLFDPELPLLDIAYGYVPEIELEQRERRHYTQRRRFRLHQIVALPLPVRPMEDDGTLLRRVRGFLKKHVAGDEIEAIQGGQ